MSRAFAVTLRRQINSKQAHHFSFVDAHNEQEAIEEALDVAFCRHQVLNLFITYHHIATQPFF